MSGFLEWVTHGVKRGRLQLDSRPVAMLSAIVIILALVAGLYLVLVGQTAARGRRIEQLQTEIFSLQRDNEQLAVEIARMSATARLMERATALGFVTAEQVEFLMGSD